MKKFLTISVLALAAFVFVAPLANAVEMKTGFKYGVITNTNGNSWAKGVSSSIRILNKEKDSSGVVKFQLVEELGYLEYALSDVMDGKILTAMTFGMVPIYDESVWLGLGTGLYSYLRTDMEDIKATALGIRLDATWKQIRFGTGADAVSLPGNDDYYLHATFGFIFE